MSKTTAKKVRLKSIDDCRRLLQKTVNEFKGGVIDEAHARCLGYLVKIISDCIRDSTLEERVAKVEELFKREDKPWPA